MKIFFLLTLGFTRSHSGPLNDFERSVQIIPGSCKSDESLNITGVDEVHLKNDWVNGNIVNGIREPILFSFALDNPTGHKNCEVPRIKLIKKMNKSVLSHYN